MVKEIEIKAYVCNKCNTIYHHKDSAEYCCKEFFCNDCGKQCRKYFSICEKCLDKRRILKATKVDYKEYKEKMFYDYESDKYFSDIDYMYDYYEDYYSDEIEKGKSIEDCFPEYVFGCYFMPFNIDIELIIKDECTNHHKDIYDCLDTKDLIEYVNNWNEKHNKCGSYVIDHDIVIPVSTMIK